MGTFDGGAMNESLIHTSGTKRRALAQKLLVIC